jgi:hypothetical protein
LKKETKAFETSSMCFNDQDDKRLKWIQNAKETLKTALQGLKQEKTSKKG